MKNKELIISLIQQDLKHNQLINGLEDIGLDGGGLHELGVLEIVAGLMKVPDEIREEWSTLYMELMNESSKYEVKERTNSLRPLAEVGYKQLKKVLQAS